MWDEITYPFINFNGDISDRLPTAVIIDNRKKAIAKIRSKVRIFGERNCRKFIDKNNVPDTGNEYKQFLANNLRDSFFLAPIDEADILREIKNLAPKKAPGPVYI